MDLNQRLFRHQIMSMIPPSEKIGHREAVHERKAAHERYALIVDDFRQREAISDALEQQREGRQLDKTPSPIEKDVARW